MKSSEQVHREEEQGARQADCRPHSQKYKPRTRFRDYDGQQFACELPELLGRHQTGSTMRREGSRGEYRERGFFI
jgi:hypothetical protein